MSIEYCPHCGAEVPARARACPGCGSDEQTGWSDEAEAGGLDLPDEDFDYPDFVRREWGVARLIPRGIHWFWWVTAAALVVLGLAGLLWVL